MRMLIVLPLLLAACSPAVNGDPAADSVQQPEAAPASPAPAAAAAPSDAEIAAIVVAANQIDAELGELAAERAASAEVRAFGTTMSRDHRAVNEQAVALVGRLGVTPVESELSRQLQSDAQAFRQQLQATTGAEFDRTYIEHEVVYHQAVIDAVDQVLIPAASNGELKQTLVSVRPALVAHLRHAEQLAAGLR